MDIQIFEFLMNFYSGNIIISIKICYWEKKAVLFYLLRVVHGHTQKHFKKNFKLVINCSSEHNFNSCSFHTSGRHNETKSYLTFLSVSIETNNIDYVRMKSQVK